MSALAHGAPRGDCWEGNLPEINTGLDALSWRSAAFIGARGSGGAPPARVGIVPLPRVVRCLGGQTGGDHQKNLQLGLGLLLHSCVIVGSVLLLQGLRHYVGCVTAGSLLLLQGLRQYVVYCYKASGTTQAAANTAITVWFQPRGPCVTAGLLLL